MGVVVLAVPIGRGLARVHSVVTMLRAEFGGQDLVMASVGLVPLVVGFLLVSRV